MVMKPLTQDYDAMRGCELSEVRQALLCCSRSSTKQTNLLKGIIPTKYQLLEKVFRNQYKILTVQLP